MSGGNVTEVMLGSSHCTNHVCGHGFHGTMLWLLACYCGHLIQLISARLLHCKFLFFFVIINEYFIGWYFEKMYISHFSSNLSLFLYLLYHGLMDMYFFNGLCNPLLSLFIFMLTVSWFGQRESLQSCFFVFLTCSDQAAYFLTLVLLEGVSGPFCTFLVLTLASDFLQGAAPI